MGVIKDFHYASLHDAVDPLAIEFSKRDAEYLLVRIDGTEKQPALAHIETTLRNAAPGTALLATFLDQHLEKLYSFDVSLMRTTQIFSLITVVVAMLGLFALAAHEAKSRTKEIGIRKVLGASMQQILVLMSKNFLLLIGASFLIAIPAAWYAGTQWLSTFSYKMELGVWMFSAPAALVLAVAMLTVIGQSMSAARTNPANSLKHD